MYALNKRTAAYVGGKRRVMLCLLSLLAAAAMADGITTAGAYFKTVSDRYAAIRDYEANLHITAGKKQMACTVLSKGQLLRLDFSRPDGQVIVYNGDMLTVYLSEYSAVLQQSAQEDDGARIATASGLSLLSRYYSMKWEVGQDSMPLDDDDSERVVRLVAYPRGSAEAFRSIRLAIGADNMLIRRVTAVTRGGETFTFDFTLYKLNRGIPNERFIYDPPSSANSYNNFLLQD